MLYSELSLVQDIPTDYYKDTNRQSHTFITCTYTNMRPHIMSALTNTANVQVIDIQHKHKIDLSTQICRIVIFFCK